MKRVLKFIIGLVVIVFLAGFAFVSQANLDTCRDLIQHDRHGLVRALICLRPSLVSVRDSKGATLLHMTCSRVVEESPETVRCLIAQGANVNAQDFDLRTPVHVLLTSPRVIRGPSSFTITANMAEMLVNSGANLALLDSRSESVAAALKKSDFVSIFHHRLTLHNTSTGD